MRTNDQIRDLWLDAKCFLDGKPATIVGYGLKFPLIKPDNGDRPFEFSWPTVDRIMHRDRRFYA